MTTAVHRGADATPTPAWFALLVGSPDTAAAVFDQARSRLPQVWPLRTQSMVLHGDSVAAGDARRYLNQVLVLAHPGDARADIVATLKHLEEELGRRPDQHPPCIDLDYLAEYSADGRECWQDAGKLAPAAFRTLLSEALSALPGSNEG